MADALDSGRVTTVDLFVHLDYYRFDIGFEKILRIISRVKNVKNLICRCGGIGRRARFRSRHDSGLLAHSGFYRFDIEFVRNFSEISAE